LATRSGIPLERWGSALTVLLEKEFGNIYIEKMWAICLMEADFNWLNKLMFAKRMRTRHMTRVMFLSSNLLREALKRHTVYCAKSYSVTMFVPFILLLEF
jgi:hypothetical protein